MLREVRKIERELVAQFDPKNWSGNEAARSERKIEREL